MSPVEASSSAYFEGVTAGQRRSRRSSILFFLFFFDEFDTAAFAVLAPEIKAAFSLTDNEFASIVILNLSVVLLLAMPRRLLRRPVAANEAGRDRRRALPACSRSLTGMATTVGALVLFRLGNGFGAAR